MAWKNWSRKGRGREITASALLQFSSRPEQNVSPSYKNTGDVVTRLSSQCKPGPHFRFASSGRTERRNRICSPCKQHARNTGRKNSMHPWEVLYIERSLQRNRSFLDDYQQDLSLSLSFCSLAFYRSLARRKLNKIGRNNEGDEYFVAVRKDISVVKIAPLFVRMVGSSKSTVIKIAVYKLKGTLVRDDRVAPRTYVVSPVPVVRTQGVNGPRTQLYHLLRNDLYVRFVERNLVEEIPVETIPPMILSIDGLRSR